mmetsp:Transcript_24198/g.72224  ORF Transcript_24198/g.72224 Transcript_24198/m.72224 type:complete len:409 (-) Transcript_24198:81-1307(-)
MPRALDHCQVWGAKCGCNNAPTADPCVPRNLTELAEYYGRFVAFYTAGGFTDDTGTFHEGFKYNIPWFEYGNEMEYGQTPELYTQQHDAVASAVRAVQPGIKFLGLGADQDEYSLGNLDFFEHFLNASNHARGAPNAAAIDYHFYSGGGLSRTDPTSYVKMFAEGDKFFDTAAEVDSLRRRLSPQTRVFLKEIGTILPGDNAATESPIPAVFWSASAAYWVYVYARLATLGTDVVSMSQFTGGVPQCTPLLPNGCADAQDAATCRCVGSNFASVTMVRWDDGRRTARYWALQLLVQELGSRVKTFFATQCKNAGCGNASTPGANTTLLVQGLRVPNAGEMANDGIAKVLVVNKIDELQTVSLGVDFLNTTYRCIDSRNPFGAPRSLTYRGAAVQIGGWAVCIFGATSG